MIQQAIIAIFENNPSLILPAGAHGVTSIVQSSVFNQALRNAWAGDFGKWAYYQAVKDAVVEEKHRAWLIAKYSRKIAEDTLPTGQYVVEYASYVFDQLYYGENTEEDSCLNN